MCSFTNEQFSVEIKVIIKIASIKSSEQMMKEKLCDLNI